MSAAAPASSRRLLVPREHGAWAQMALPQVAALVLGGVSVASVALCLATVLGFVAHEPALVLLGTRGQRLRELDGPRARRTLVALLTPAAIAGAVGLWLAPWPARLLLGLAGLLAAVLLGLATRRLERTMVGELVVISAFVAAGTATALAAGAHHAQALTMLVTWGLAFAASVFAVHVILSRAQSKGANDPGVRHAVIVAVLSGGGSVLAWQGGLGWVVPAAVAPMALLSIVVCLSRFTARDLHRLGWGLAAASTSTLVLLVLGARVG